MFIFYSGLPGVERGVRRRGESDVLCGCGLEQCRSL
jgi:hypothetical protein